MRCRFPHPGQISKGARGSTCNAAPGRFGSWEITVRDPYKIAACFPCRNPWQLSESQSRYEIAIPDDGTSRTKRRHPSAAPNMARRRAAHAVACVRHRPASICAGKRRNSWGLFFSDEEEAEVVEDVDGRRRRSLQPDATPSSALSVSAMTTPRHQPGDDIYGLLPCGYPDCLCQAGRE